MARRVVTLMTERTIDLLATIHTSSAEGRYKAALHILRDLTEQERKDCLEDLWPELEKTEIWMEYTTDEWGGYVDNANSPTRIVAEILGAIGDPSSFYPLLKALVLEHPKEVKDWIVIVLEQMPLPEDPYLKPIVLEALKDPRIGDLGTVPARVFTRGKKLAELLPMLDDEEKEIRLLTFLELSAITISKEEKLVLVRELRRLLRRDVVENPPAIFLTLWKHATSKEMLGALLDDFLERHEFDSDISPEHWGSIGFAFTTLGYWMGTASGRAVPRMTALLNQLKNLLPKKELCHWYSCINKITTLPPESIVEGMVELFEMGNDGIKDDLLTDLQYVFGFDKVEALFQKHLHSETPSLGGTTTMGQRIAEILRTRAMWRNK